MKDQTGNRLSSSQRLALMLNQWLRMRWRVWNKPRRKIRLQWLIFMERHYLSSCLVKSVSEKLKHNHRMYLPNFYHICQKQKLKKLKLPQPQELKLVLSKWRLLSIISIRKASNSLKRSFRCSLKTSSVIQKFKRRVAETLSRNCSRALTRMFRRSSKMW